MVFVLLPGRQPLNFYICATKIDTHELQNPLIKMNYTLVGAQILSVLLHIAGLLEDKLFCSTFKICLTYFLGKAISFLV